MLSSWAELVRDVFKTWTPPAHDAHAGPDTARADPACVAALLDGAPVYRGLRLNTDAMLNTLRYLYAHMRCGVYVGVRGGAVRSFVPFVNPHYTNTWHDRVVFVCPSTRRCTTSINEYMDAVREPQRRHVLPLHRWWLNGATVCNIEAPGGWGTAFLDVLRAQLVAAASASASAFASASESASASLSDADFFLNKRDYPQLRMRRAAEPYARFTNERDDAPLAREAYSCYAPVFSFYTTAVDALHTCPLAMADIPMPSPEDWESAAASTTTPHAPRRAVAIFRGSATGQGTRPATNVRLRLAHYSRRNPDIVDAGIVAWNDARDRVLCAEDVRALVPCDADPRAIYISRPQRDPELALVPRMSLAEQVAEAAFMLYADGHVAAGRYGALMHTGRVILRVATAQPECGQAWAQLGTVAAFISADGAAANVPPDADHFLIDPQLENLRSTIEFLRANDAVAARVAACARARAPTRQSIAQYWRDAIAAVSKRQRDECADIGTGAVAGAGAGAGAWFSAVDPEYASTTTVATHKLL